MDFRFNLYVVLTIIHYSVIIYSIYSIQLYTVFKLTFQNHNEYDIKIFNYFIKYNIYTFLFG